MPNTKKTLIAKISYDVSNIPDAAIPHFKAGMKATALASGLKEDQIDFEILGNEEIEEIPEIYSIGDLISDFFSSLFRGEEDDERPESDGNA